MWRLVLTTGFVGTILCLSFFAFQFLRRARGPSPLDVTTCTVLLVAVLCFFVYDSLGSAMFTALIAVGLMARADVSRTTRRWLRDARTRPTPSASYAAEVARLLWPEPWEAPYVTRDPAPRAGCPTATPTSSRASDARACWSRPTCPASVDMLRRLGTGRSALAGPVRQPARALGPLARLRAGPVADAAGAGDGPGRRLDRAPPRRSASAPTCGSASCSAPAGSTRSRCSRSSASTARLLGYAKVGHNDLTAALVRREADSLATVGARLPRSFRVPRAAPPRTLGRPRGPGAVAAGRPASASR